MPSSEGGNGSTSKPTTQIGRNDTETAGALQTIAKALDETLNPMAHEGLERTTGFCLLVFGFGESGISNYVSNAKREDMIEALEETVKRLKAAQDNVRFGDDDVRGQ